MTFALSHTSREGDYFGFLGSCGDEFDTVTSLFGIGKSLVCERFAMIKAH